MAKHMEEEIKSYYGGIAKKVSETTKSSCCGDVTCCDGSADSSLYTPEYTAGRQWKQLVHP
jgi:hypothetical protein